ncbi:MAG: hypothetical protein AAB370_11470 [Verrucomicrobiota bacterium]
MKHHITNLEFQIKSPRKSTGEDATRRIALKKIANCALGILSPDACDQYGSILTGCCELAKWSRFILQRETNKRCSDL